MTYVDSGPVSPIGEHRRQQVRAATGACLRRAAAICRLPIPAIDIHFDLGGRAAGMYRVRQGRRCIRFNPYILARYFDEGIAETVPHEVAHYATDLLFGLGNIRPHGPEWQALMSALGGTPVATARYDLTGIPVRRQRRFGYRCGCSTHRLSTRRHNRIQQGRAAYLCRRCKAPLVLAGAEAGTTWQQAADRERAHD
jgi:SprT protein